MIYSMFALILVFCSLAFQGTRDNPTKVAVNKNKFANIGANKFRRVVGFVGRLPHVAALNLSLCEETSSTVFSGLKDFLIKLVWGNAFVEHFPTFFEVLEEKKLKELQLKQNEYLLDFQTGTEAVTESFYRVVEKQEMDGGQSLEVLSNHAKVDWCFPPILQCERALTETAKIYINGNKTLVPEQQTILLQAVPEQRPIPLQEVSEQQTNPLQAVPEQQTIRLQAVPEQRAIPLQAVPEQQTNPLQAVPEQQSIPLQAVSEQQTDPLQAVPEQQIDFFQAVPEQQTSPLQAEPENSKPILFKQYLNSKPFLSKQYLNSKPILFKLYLKQQAIPLQAVPGQQTNPLQAILEQHYDMFNLNMLNLDMFDVDMFDLDMFNSNMLLHDLSWTNDEKELNELFL
ncbi:Hypothetical predicted protein [Paramuricea clavata]|uniref:Uncharacterized protein n=1 Tax=Paramuricea clavata TaxID=317549 RepID=A0A7D9JAR0_PARCT|nr:Hypothetical predicted protein [Paramuricea clavata]